MLHLKMHIRFHFNKHKKLQKKQEEKDAFDVAVVGSIGDAIKGTLLNLKSSFLHVLCILNSTKQTELWTFLN